MAAQMKYRVWIVVWSCSCLLAINMMQGKNSALAHDRDVKNDAISYWETRLHGARMPSSVCAMVSPLSSHEATQLLVNISTSGGHYLPAHAATFCRAAHIQCAQAGKECREDTSKITLFYGAHQTEVGTGTGDHTEKITFAYDALQIEAAGKESKEGGKQVDKEVGASSQDKPTVIFPLASSSVHHISSFFFRKNKVLVSGVDIHVNFAGYINGDAGDGKTDRAFLPRKLAKLFPLHGNGAKIANMLGLSEEDLQETLDLCKAGRGMHAQVRMCLTSIEDVADFVWSILGASPDHGIRMYDAIGNASAAKLQKAGNIFHVLDVKELTADLDRPFVACHDMAFPFRVFYCHYIKQTKIFQIILQGEDESRHERIAVCHYDTSYWSPLHMAFAELQTKPGESEVCHWLGGTWLGHSGWVFVHGAAALATVM